VLLPPVMSSTVQVDAPPPGAVAVNCRDCDTARPAIFGDTVTVPLEILTVAVAAPLMPPGPVQVSEYVTAAVSAPVFRVPLAACAPVQPPDAVHVVASVEVQVSVEAPALVTVVGFAVNVTVGREFTVTVAVTAVLVPPGPVQVSELGDSRGQRTRALSAAGGLRAGPAARRGA